MVEVSVLETRAAGVPTELLTPFQIDRALLHYQDSRMASEETRIDADLLSLSPLEEAR